MIYGVLRAIVAVSYLGIVAFPGQAHSDSETIKTQLRKYVVEIRSAFPGAGKLGVGVVSESFTDEGSSHTRILCPATTAAYDEKGKNNVFILLNGKQYEGTVEYTDNVLNVSRVSVSGVALPPAPRLKEGENFVQRKVFVIGNSGALDATTAVGIVKKVEPYAGIPYLYTSAPVTDGAKAAFIIDDRGNFLGIAGLTVTEGSSVLIVGVDVQTIEKAIDASWYEFVLRYGAENNQGKYSTKDRALIAYEHLLGRWLVGTNPNESSPRYIQVREAWNSGLDVDFSDKNAFKAAQGKAEITYNSLLEQLLAEQNAAPPATGKTTKLVCSMADNKGENRSDFNVEIDYRNNLANGWKAEIYEGEVRWKYPADKKYEGILNRYTGNIRLFAEGAGLMLVGPCAKAETRKF